VIVWRGRPFDFAQGRLSPANVVMGYRGQNELDWRLVFWEQDISRVRAPAPHGPE